MKLPDCLTLASMCSALVIATLSGCSTPYQNVGDSVAGGFASERIDGNRFVVSFAGNGFTKPKKARDFAILRAAEVTLEHNYSHFTIDGQGDHSTVSTVHIGSTATTTGTISPSGTFTGFTNTTSSTIPIFKPASEFTITCYETVPKNNHLGRVLDARAVAAEIRAKYHLKQTELAPHGLAW